MKALQGREYTGIASPFTKSNQQKTMTADLLAITRDGLWIRLGGDKEVITPVGKIDLVTSKGKEVIVVEPIENWKAAIGQVLVYGSYYPSHQKIIHLFGKCHETYLDLIRGHCEQFNIIITWEI